MVGERRGGAAGTPRTPKGLPWPEKVRTCSRKVGWAPCVLTPETERLSQLPHPVSCLTLGNLLPQLCLGFLTCKRG